MKMRVLRKTTHTPTLMDLGTDCLMAIDRGSPSTNSLLMPCMHMSILDTYCEFSFLHSLSYEALYMYRYYGR